MGLSALQASLALLTLLCTAGLAEEFEPEWGSWNFFGERSALVYGSPNFSYVPAKMYPVYKRNPKNASSYQSIGDNLTLWMWGTGCKMYAASFCEQNSEQVEDALVVSVYPPGTAGKALYVGGGTFTKFTILGQTYPLWNQPGYKVTPNGNDVVVSVIQYAPYGNLLTGTWTTVAKGQLPDASYCLPLHDSCPGAGGTCSMIYDNPKLGISFYLNSQLLTKFYLSSAVTYTSKDFGIALAQFGQDFGGGVPFSSWRGYTQPNISYIGPDDGDYFNKGKKMVANVSIGNPELDGLYFPRCLCGVS